MSKEAKHTSIAVELMQEETIETTKCKLLKCSKCEKRYTSNVTLRRHLQLFKCKQHKLINTGEKPYACSFCEKTFCRIYNCKRHERIHTGERPYSCSFCKKTFRHISSCKEHERIHTGERPYACSFCEKTFCRISIRKQHERIHTGERPYSCSFCKKTFRHISSCKEHERIHTGERPYACSFCEKTFTTITTCKRHERIHTGERPYACFFCKKTFTELTNCKQHKHIHTGERPYTCSFCEKTFTTISHCKKHEHLHTDKSPYVCDTCHKNFDSLSNLQHHVSIHEMKTLYECGKGLAQFGTHCSALKGQEKANQNTSSKKCSPSKAYHRKKYLPLKASTSRVSYRKKHTMTAKNANNTGLLSDCDQFSEDSLADPDNGTFEVQDEFQEDEIITEKNLELDTEEILEQEKITQLETMTVRNIAVLKKFDESREDFEKVKKGNVFPVDVTTLGRKERKLGTAVADSENDQNKHFDVSEKFPIETEKTNSYLAKNSTIDSLVNSFVTAAKLQGVVLHMSVAADEGIVNFVNENKNNGDVDKGNNTLSSVDIAKILRMLSEKDNFQSKKAANHIKEGTHDSAVGETVICQCEKSKYSTKLLTPIDGTSSYQPQSDVRDATMNSLAKALTSAAKLQGVVLHVYCLK